MEVYNTVEEVVAAMMKTADHYGLGHEVMQWYTRYVIEDNAQTIAQHVRAASDALYEWDI